MGADLRGVDLRGEDLTEADLRGADLRGASLAGMRLDAVDLSGADLRGADLSGVRMTGGSLSGARLDGSRWERAAIVGVGGVLEGDDRAGPDGGSGLAGCPELAVAAVVGRDAPEPMVAAAGHEGCAAFSPDGGLLVVGVDGEVLVVDAGTWTMLRVLHEAHGRVQDVWFSRDGTQFASAGYPGYDGASIWDARTGAPGRAPLPPGMSTAGTRGWRDGGSEAVRSPDGTGSARAYSVTTQESAEYLGDGNYEMRPARTTFFLELQGAPGGRRRYELDHEVRALGYIDGGAVLIAVLGDGTVRAWQVATGDHDVFLRLQEPWSWPLFSPGGEFLSVRSRGGLGIWDLTARRRCALLPVHPGPGGLPPVLVLSPDRSVLVTVSGGTVQAWDTTTWELVATLAGRPSAVAVAVSPDASLVAAGYSDGTARIWDTATGRQARVLGGHDGYVASVAFSPDGAFLATAAADSVRTWDAASWTPRVMTSPRLVLLGVSVAFSPDGTSLAGLRTRGRSAVTWDAATGTRKPLVLGDDRRVLGYAPDGTLLATADDPRHGGVLWVEDAASPARRVLLAQNDRGFSKAAMSPDGRLIVTWSAKQAPRAWLLPQPLPRVFPGRRRKLDPFARLGTDGVTSVAFSADSRLIFTGMANGTVRTWDAATGAPRPVPALAVHDGLAAIAASADGSTIATVSRYGTVRVWDANAGKAVAMLAAFAGEGHAAWFPDGSYRADDSTGTLWWAIKLCRFEPGELDPYLPALRRRGEAETITPSA
jgi:WD40 repeat protein